MLLSISVTIPPFQSTLPQGERPCISIPSRFNVSFQSTLPQGERLRFCEVKLFACYFNPRSHKGSDVDGLLTWISTIISIHAPTRGATFFYILCPCILMISIHAPTRGATKSISPVQSPTEISIHAPTRGATLRFHDTQFRQRNFNPRSHKGSDEKL